MAEQPAVELRSVDKHFGDLHVLRDINLTVAPGEVVVVIGPSGSGKSTLCRAINRLEPIDSGEIFVHGELLPDEGKALARLRADVGMVFQSFNLFAHKTVRQNVTLGPVKVKGVPQREADERADQLLNRVGITEQAEKYPAQLSGGQQQRVAIARSLINDPYIILADEATGNLDSVTSGEIMDMLERLNQSGKTIIMVTHEDDIAEYAKRIIRMRDGVIVDDGPSPRMLESQSNVVHAG
jgi:glutamate transport system ATP-binding protein